MSKNKLKHEDRIRVVGVFQPGLLGEGDECADAYVEIVDKEYIAIYRTDRSLDRADDEVFYANIEQFAEILEYLEQHGLIGWDYAERTQEDE